MASAPRLFFFLLQLVHREADRFPFDLVPECHRNIPSKRYPGRCVQVALPSKPLHSHRTAPTIALVHP